MKQKLESKKGAMFDLPKAAVGGIIGLFLLVLIGFVYFTTLSNANLLGTATAASNATDRMVANVTAGVDTISAQVPTIFSVIMVVLIIGVIGLLGAFGYSKMRGGGYLG